MTQATVKFPRLLRAIAKLLIIFQTQKFMDKKNINIRQKMFQEGKSYSSIA